MKLLVVAVSTREGRLGFPLAQWMHARAAAHAGFEPELVDLREVALPMFDEPNHPRLGTYQHAHTRAWSARIAPADAFVFVTPEYNHGAPPSLLNALAYLSREWAYKPAGFLTYGGVSAGTRGMQMAKQVLVGLKVMPIPEGIHVPFFAKHVADGVFDGSAQDLAATAMLDELARWARALAPLRPAA